MPKKVSNDCHIGSIKVSSREVSEKVPRKMSGGEKNYRENAKRTAG